MKIKQRGNSFFVMDGERHVCRISCDNNDAEKLARQFAASDDLLTACVLFVEARESNNSQLLRVAESVARAAIEKAGGQ